MKYQVFLFSFFCFTSSFAMEKSVNKSEPSLRNSALVADALTIYVMYALENGFDVDRESLARDINGVRQSPLTGYNRDKALLLIMDEHMELVRKNRQAWEEQENWGLIDNGPTKKRKKTN